VARAVARRPRDSPGHPLLHRPSVRPQLGEPAVIPTMGAGPGAQRVVHRRLEPGDRGTRSPQLRRPGPRPSWHRSPPEHRWPRRLIRCTGREPAIRSACTLIQLPYLDSSLLAPSTATEAGSNNHGEVPARAIEVPVLTDASVSAKDAVVKGTVPGLKSVWVGIPTGQSRRQWCRYSSIWRNGGGPRSCGRLAH